MRPIPQKLRERLASSKFMKTCCINNAMCQGKVDWHHVWIYAGRQINEFWAIVGACQYHHPMAENPEIKRLFQHFSLIRASDEDLAKYPHKNWVQIKSSINL